MTEPIELAASIEPQDSFDLLYELIKEGKVKSLAELRGRLENPAEKALVKAASLVSFFDQELFNNVLLLSLEPGSEKISFDDFVRNSNVEEIPRTVRVFRIREAAREKALQEWYQELGSNNSLTQSQFFKKLLDHYPNPDDLERLGLLVLTKSEQAAVTFTNLFATADNLFDLARCNDLLKVLDDRFDFLTDELKKLRTEKRQLLNARNLFARDYYQSTFYYARNSVVKSFQELLKTDATPRQEWCFQLYAKGGMGKTMFVKWLLARHCVPHQIPIARIDFDFIHLPTAVRFPSLMLLAIAEQLNVQIPDSDFDTFLRSNSNFISLLRPPHTVLNEDRQRIQKQFQEVEPQLRDSLVGRFRDSLVESTLKNNVIVVFDTMEEMSLSRQQTLLAVLDQLKQIHDSYPRLRLLLAGRYNLVDRLPKFREEFAKHTVTHELAPFDKTEARAFLKQKRSMTNGPIIKAIIKKCQEEPSESRKQKTPSEEFNPFKLSLFVDLFQQGEVKTVDDIRSYPNSDIEYLIERVVRRIKEPTVQWLLRYAAIPRQFTYEIFEQVLAPNMVEELIEDRKWDLVNEKFPAGAEAFNNQENWKDLKRGKTRTLNLRAIWNNLRKYASSYSFISFDTGDDSAPRLQPEVTVPMRRLLEEQQVFPTLHRDAEKFFFEKADQQSNSLGKAQQLVETIYHRFQWEGAAASAYWRSLIERSDSQRQPSFRKLLAEEILGKDYVDDLGQPVVKHTGAVMVEPATLSEAYLRTIEATVSQAANMKFSERPNAWEEISQRLDELQALERRYPKLRVQRAIKLDLPVLRALAALLRQTEPNFKSAIPVLRQALKSAATEQMKIALQLQLADALSLENNPACVAQYNRVLKLVRSTKTSQMASSGVLLKIGLWYQRQRNFAGALRTFRAALFQGAKEDDPAAILNAQRYMADISLELDHYDEALQLLRKVIKSQGKEPSLLDALLVGQVLGRSLYQPLQALAQIKPFAESDTTVREKAALKELTGDLYGQLMRFEEALDLLEESKNLWVSASNPESADRARILRIELQLFEIGNFDEADYLLKVAEDLGNNGTLENVTYLKLLRALWVFRKGDRPGALRLARKITNEKKLSGDAGNRISILATILAMGLGDGKTVGEFIRLLRGVERSSRLSLLDAFAHQHEKFPGTPSQKQAIAKLLTIPLQGKDLIPHAMKCANVLTWCGANTSAKRHLDRAAQSALRTKNSFAYRQILLAKDRLGFINPKTDRLSRSNFLKDYAAFPALCGAALAEQAQRYWRLNNLSQCKAAVAASFKRFSVAETLVSRHTAALDELAGELARTEGRSVEATRYFRAAHHKYQKLGNKSKTDELNVVRVVAEHSIERDEPDLLLEIKVTPKSLVQELYENDLKILSKPLTSARTPQLVRLLKAEIRDRSSLYKLSKLMLDRPAAFERELGRILFDSVLKTRRKKGDFHLHSLSPALAKMPWELASVSDKLFIHRDFYRSSSSQKSQTTKWLQLALVSLGFTDVLVDGLHGPKSAAALTELRKKNKWPLSLKGTALTRQIGKLLVKGKPLRKSRALIIRSKDQQSRTRSSSLLEWIYGDCYFQVEVIEPNVSLRRVLNKFQPDVIHIEAGFRELPNSGEIYLDFEQSGKESKSASEALSFSALNQVLGHSSDYRMRPLVILDARCPATITEALHQLFYRNAFASQLFEAEQVSAVIAMGLTVDSDLYHELAMNLVSDLSNTVSFGEIVGSLRKLPRQEALAQRLATRGIALFTNEPWLTVLSAERRS